jgi:ribosome biogenesis protein SSF1/2
MRHPKSGRGKRQGRGPRIPAAVLRKQQAAAPNVDQVTGAKIPKSFVFSRGKVPSTLRHLQLDLRKVMLPYTALNLKVYILLLHIPRHSQRVVALLTSCDVGR